MGINSSDTRAHTYQLRRHGQLDERWADWFDGFTLISVNELHTEDQS